MLMRLHIRDNLKHKLHDFGITGVSGNLLFEDAFGCHEGSNRKIGGFCDTVDSALAGYKSVWKIGLYKDSGSMQKLKPKVQVTSIPEHY